METAAATPPAIAVGAALPDQAAGAAAAAPGSAAGKNILIFITDQQRRTRHFPAGWEQENLPGLTRLKENGVSFENAFSNTAMCSPSRATLFTGLYPAQHGVKYTLELDMPAEDYPQVELSPDLTNLATVMSAAGYEVVYKGKWHLSKPVAGGSDWSPEDLARYGFTRWNSPDGGANQDISEAGGGVVDHDGRYLNADGDAEDGAEGVLKFINDRADATRPWCLVVSLVNPHDVLFYPGPPNQTTPKYIEAGYDPSWLEGDIGLPVTYDEDLSTKPRCQAQFAKLFGASGPLPTRETKLNYVNFYGNLLKLADSHLVAILDALEDTGRLADTLVVRTSDHGEMALAHNMRQKSFNAYEETIHMPLVFSNPELFPEKRTSYKLVSHVDLLPTLASLVDAPAEARSRDWAGIDYSRHVLARDPRPTQDHVVFTFDDWQSGQARGPYVPAPNRIVAIRERRWKLARYYDASGKKPEQWEMYDLKKDPLERRNLAFRPRRMTPQQRRQFKRLRKRLRHIQRTTLAA
ncbi:hypothetical protein GCM10027062_31200 [Nocardioides hungaricus]